VRDAHGVVHVEGQIWQPLCEPHRCFAIEPDFARVMITEDAPTCVSCLIVEVRAAQSRRR